MKTYKTDYIRNLALLDTPGYFDFVASVQEALSVVEGVLLVAKASAPLEVGMEKAWERANEYRLAKMLWITEIDAKVLDMQEVIELYHNKFEEPLAIIHIPWYEQEKSIGILDVLNQVGYDLEGRTVELSETTLETLKPFYIQLIESLVETDEALMERYFLDEKL